MYIAHDIQVIKYTALYSIVNSIQPIDSHRTLCWFLPDSYLYQHTVATDEQMYFPHSVG